MKKLFFVLGFLFTIINLSAHDAVSRQDETYSNSTGSIDFTVGEVIINTVKNDLTQGFHQRNWNFLGVENFATDYVASIFPNPTADVLNIKINTFENVTYMLCEAQVKRVMKHILSVELTPIELSQFALRSYSLERIFENGTDVSLSLS
jgi:hypothetical protein